MKDLTFVLDIGSSKLSLLACCIAKGKSLVVTSIDKAYDGFMDGEFFSVEQVKQTITDMLDEMHERIGKPVRNIHIGVPSEFSACVCKRVTRNFVPAKRIDDELVASLFDGVGEFGTKNNYVVISFSPLKYELDGVETIELNNKRISEFIMDCSYILAKKQFVDTMQDIFNSCNVKDIDFVSTALAQARLVNKRNCLKPIVVVDVGHITTSVAIAKGEGLLMLSSFSLGGGHITADLMQVNNLSYTHADMIKRKVCLTIQSKKDERYIVYDNDKPIKALIGITNEIVTARIENIANVVNRILSIDASFADLPVYLTGDGVCNFRGIINVFEAVCGRKIQFLKNPLDNGNDKYQTSKIGLVNIIGDLV